ncbi:MAG: hypothetical protein MJ097_07105 [Dorea sp.]|nr:hypothetical protein [Dorea sp.]
MMKKLRHALFLLVLIQIFVFAAFPNTAKAAHKNEWVTVNEKMVYYGANGKKVTGIQKIGKSQYYFNSSGVQRVGWQKIDEDYYFFRIANGTGGYMLRGKTQNGIELKSNGKASLTSEAKKKLTVLVKAQKLVEANTKPLMTTSEKLKAMWKVIIKYKYLGSPAFNSKGSWDVTYAKAMFTDKHGSCYHYAAAFAYLANAVGCKDCKAVSSGGHGWAEVNGYIYDPSWQNVDGANHSYYRVDPKLSGKGGRPQYSTHRTYVKKI